MYLQNVGYINRDGWTRNIIKLPEFEYEKKNAKAFQN